MLPTLEPGDHVFVDQRAYRRREPVEGEVVLARPGALQGRVIVKRVGRVEPDRVWLISDNPAEGTDSESFGPVPLTELIGRVEARVPAD